MIKRPIVYRRLPVIFLAGLFIAHTLPASAAGQSAAVNQSPDDDSIEVSDIKNYNLSDFKWDEPKDGDFMLGNFKGEEVFTGEMAKMYPGIIQVRIRLRNARIVDTYLTHRGKRISQPVNASDERVLLRRPEWNRGPECVPRRQVYTVRRRVRNRVRVCQVILIVPRNCPAKVTSKICFAPRSTRRR